ncbi:uncharacterized protein DUF4249 [Arcicella aurantiaca]|uniref:Uncharacterized protein DUF4249 n=1 Tax=Arcicella aurantiaca TaxID=591202 RepID=A0A316ED56_9BACT|nr:DUF4249 domain-containing protein [Arcicella aurantiaca]PWK28136.1 uncharacterized protein DUF4249 [Arcicella aurantiaca]
MKISKQYIYQEVNTTFNSFIRYSLFAVSALFLISCEDVISLDVQKTDPYLVVDGSITNLAGEQVIRLTKSQDLLSEATPEGVKNATVKVTDNLGKVYEFKDLKNEGKYVWTPTNATEVMGVIGKTYSLEIQSEGEIYKASSKLNRVPKIDSIVYKLDDANVRQTGDGKPKKGYDAQFYARDLKGVGDCYRIKVYQNGKLRNGADNIVIAYDGIANKSTFGDSLAFITPLRRLATTELFNENDKIKVELLSITEAHFDFWTQLRQELNNAGLFARPAARVPSNIINVNTNSAKQAAGWFGTSAVTSMEVVVDKTKAVKDFTD